MNRKKMRTKKYITVIPHAPFITMVALLLLCTGAAKAKDYHMGTYNIRCINATLTGLRDWDNRKEYVAKIITDNRFDVIGLQEIANDDQENDLRQLLPEYSMVTWGRESAEKNEGERLAVAFKTSDFALLDQGHYFLTPDPEVPGLAWDATHKRVSVWAKLQDKNTGETFFYCSTHLDNDGVVARKEGARLNVEMMNKLAGEYPVFIVGDLNAKATEKGVHATMGAYYDDSRLTSGLDLSASGPEGTYSGWNPERSDNKRIDYVYSRHADVKSYKVITEDYGRGETPSDHFCVIVSVALRQPVLPQNIYVCGEEGDDSGDGTLQSPFKTIGKAISMASSCDTLRITEGRYLTENRENIDRTKYLKVKRTLCIIGGYDKKFEKITGYTTIDGDFNGNDRYDDEGKVIGGNEDNCKLLVYVYSPALLHIENVKICNAFLDDNTVTRGAGIYSIGAGIKMKNVIFMNNISKASGGAVKATTDIDAENCTFFNNRAASGGAVYVSAKNWSATLRNCHFEANVAESGSALHIDKNTTLYARGNSFIGNHSSRYGCISVIGEAISSKFTFVNNTFAGNALAFEGEVGDDIPGGSAIYFRAGTDGKISLVNNTIAGNFCESTGNASGFKGAAVQLVSGWVFMYNNIVAGNHSTGGIGDICYESAGIKNCMGKHNLYTSADNIVMKQSGTDIMAADYGTGLSWLAQTLDGTVSGDRFEASPKNEGNGTYTVGVLNPQYGTTPINNLAKRDLNEYYMTMTDLDGGLRDEAPFTLLEQDQTGRPRDMEGHATIGAYEYIGTIGICDRAVSEARAYYFDGQVRFAEKIAGDYKIYDAEGKLIQAGRVEDDKIPVVVGKSRGICLCIVKTEAGYRFCKFLRQE